MVSIRQQTASGHWLTLHVSLAVYQRHSTEIAVGATTSPASMSPPSVAITPDIGSTRIDDKVIVCTSHVIADDQSPATTGSNQFKPVVTQPSFAMATCIVGPQPRPGGKSVIVSARHLGNRDDFRSRNYDSHQIVMAKTEAPMTSTPPSNAVAWQPVVENNYIYSTGGNRGEFRSSEIVCGTGGGGGHTMEFGSWSPWVADDYRQTIYAPPDFVMGGLGGRYGVTGGDHGGGWSTTMSGCRRQTGHVTTGDVAGITYG